MSYDVENGSCFQSCINEPISLNFIKPTINAVQFQSVWHLLENDVKMVKFKIYKLKLNVQIWPLNYPEDII